MADAVDYLRSDGTLESDRQNHRRNAARYKTLDYEQYGQMVSVSTAKHRDRRCYDGVAEKQRRATPCDHEE